MSDFAALLFTWGIPHADDWGIIPGSVGAIKALVVPRRKKTDEQIEKALKELQSAGLIWRYIYKNKEYLQYITFDRHQEGLHKRTDPKNPLFLEVKSDSENFREIPGNSRLNEGKGIEEKGNEGKRNVPSSSRKDVVDYAETVYLTLAEYQKFCDEFTEQGAKRLIEILDNYKTNTPKKCREYRDDNKVIRTWVIERYNKEKGNQPQQPQGNITQHPSALAAWGELSANIGKHHHEWSDPDILRAATMIGGTGIIGQSPPGSMKGAFVNAYTTIKQRQAEQ